MADRIFDENRGAVLRRDGNGLKVAQGMQIAEAANHVFRSAHFKQAAAHLIGAGANFFNDRAEGNRVIAKFVRIEIYLVFANESADSGDFGDARNSFQLVAQIPILETAQIGEAALVAAIDERVFVYPACSRRVRTDYGMNVGGEAARDLLHVFQNS